MVFTRKTIVTAVLAALLFASTAYGYQKHVDARVFAIEADTRQILLDTSVIEKAKLTSQIDQTTQELAQKQAELTAKTKEIDAKKAELEKANSDLTAKIKELDAANKKITNQKSELDANSKKLEELSKRPPLFTFSVESSSVSDIEQKKEDIKSLVTAAYGVMVDIYGNPYLLSSVTITFVDSFSTPGAAAEIVISNGSEGLKLTIKLKDFNKNSFNDVSAVIHEIIHSFHGLAILDPVKNEEGITVAATDVVMEKLIGQGAIAKFSPLYIRIALSEYLNTSLTIPSNYSSFYGSDNTADYYQLAGFGWYQLYKADSDFFKTFNNKIYTYKRDGNEISGDIVKKYIKESVNKSIQGKSVDEWLQTAAFK